MTKQDLDKIFELAHKLDIEDPNEALIFHERIFEPLYDAIQNSDITTIEYLENCKLSDRDIAATIIEDAIVENNIVSEGVTQVGYERVVGLFRLVCEENGWNADEILREG